MPCAAVLRFSPLAPLSRPKPAMASMKASPELETGNPAGPAGAVSASCPATLVGMPPGSPLLPGLPTGELLDEELPTGGLLLEGLLLPETGGGGTGAMMPWPQPVGFVSGKPLNVPCTCNPAQLGRCARPMLPPRLVLKPDTVNCGWPTPGPEIN